MNGIPKQLLGLLLAGGLLAGCGRKQKAPEEIALPELNRALQVWIMNKGSMPRDLNELTNFPAFVGRRLPTPPPGKKLTYDPATRQIVFADQ
jgi:hypothetical protein